VLALVSGGRAPDIGLLRGEATVLIATDVALVRSRIDALTRHG